MDYKNIIYNVAKTLDPDLDINVSIFSVDKAEFLGDAHFVVADIHYPERDMRIPFVIYNNGDLYSL